MQSAKPHLTRHLAARLVAQHILVNAIAPGAFPTHMLSIGVGEVITCDGGALIA